MVIKVLNLDKCIKKFENAGNIDLYPVIVKATGMVQNNAKVYAPVDTGRLRGSIHRKSYKRGKDSYGRVFTNVEYAPYQEFGYSRKIKKGDSLFGGKRTASKDTDVVVAGKGFMRRALGEQQGLITKEVEGYIDNYLRKIKK